MDGAWAKPLLRENSGVVVVSGGCSRCFGKGDLGQFLLQGLRDDLVIVNGIVAGDMLNLDLSGIGGIPVGMLKGPSVMMGRVVGSSTSTSTSTWEEEMKTPSGDIWVLVVQNHG
jgi:hypothetical protein